MTTATLNALRAAEISRMIRDGHSPSAARSILTRWENMHARHGGSYWTGRVK